ncbi:hypothetical protein HF086_016184 [Spodoptera exigua]|uniref:Uncharacterized protein n=1 Tax=Spodoptera exigua TaxID=7107 RepID=A0A922MJF2_SPOEX|nr:hypothetical protein HF086_016184 [Spodoptera exigua]
MFKLLVFACMLAVGMAAPNPALLFSAPYTAYAAPLASPFTSFAYSAYTAPVSFSAYNYAYPSPYTALYYK